MKNLLGALGLACVLLAAGCTSGTQAGPAQTDSKTSSFKVALLTPGPVSDAGWSAMAYEGLQAIEKDLGAEVTNKEAKEAQIRDAMRTYAQAGYQLVIGHGFEYNDPGMEVAKDFPETVFVSSSGGKTSENCGTIRFYLEQGFYVAGYVSALTSKSGHLAMIGGPDVPSIRSTFKAFKAGAEAAKPGIKVTEIFTGENADVAKAKQAALTAIGSGADVLVHQANAGAQGVFDAAKEKGVLAVGANLNQNDNESGVVFCSAVISAKPAFLDLAKRVKEGTYKGEVTLMGMDKGAIDFIWNDSLLSRVPAEAQEKAKQLIEEIKTGKLTVPKDEF